MLFRSPEARERPSTAPARKVAFPSAQRPWGDPESRYRGPSEYCYANLLKVVLFAYPTYLNHPKCDALRKLRTERTDGVGRRTQRHDLWLSFNLDENQVSERLLTAAGRGA